MDDEREREQEHARMPAIVRAALNRALVMDRARNLSSWVSKATETGISPAFRACSRLTALIEAGAGSDALAPAFAAALNALRDSDSSDRNRGIGYRVAPEVAADPGDAAHMDDAADRPYMIILRLEYTWSLEEPVAAMAVDGSLRPAKGRGQSMSASATDGGRMARYMRSGRRLMPDGWETLFPERARKRSDRVMEVCEMGSRSHDREELVDALGDMDDSIGGVSSIPGMLRRAWVRERTLTDDPNADGRPRNPFAHAGPGWLS